VKLNSAHARDLATLVELEAHWENLRYTSNAGAAIQDLQTNQKAYEAFRAKLATYNRKYSPAHVPENLLNTPTRLGRWCQRMRDLYSLLQADSLCHYPVHLLQKAQRCAERIGARTNQIHPTPTQPGTLTDAIRELENLRQWCENLTQEATNTVSASTESPT
jgi:hypothetical protein